MQKSSMSNMQSAGNNEAAIIDELNNAISANPKHIWHVVFDRSYPNKSIFAAQLALQKRLYEIVTNNNTSAFVYNVADKLLKNSGEILQGEVRHVKLPRVRISPNSMRPANLNHAWQAINKITKTMPGHLHSLILIAREETEVSPKSRIEIDDVVFSNAVIIPADVRAISEWETKAAFIGLSDGPYKIGALSVKLTPPLTSAPCRKKKIESKPKNEPKRKYIKKDKAPDTSLPIISTDAYACINYIKHLDAYIDAGIKVINGDLAQVLTEFKQACHDERPSRAVLLQISTHAVIAEYELKEAFSVKPEILKEVNAQKLY